MMPGEGAGGRGKPRRWFLRFRRNASPSMGPSPKITESSGVGILAPGEQQTKTSGCPNAGPAQALAFKPLPLRNALLHTQKRSMLKGPGSENLVKPQIFTSVHRCSKQSEQNFGLTKKKIIKNKVILPIYKSLVKPHFRLCSTVLVPQCKGHC